MSYTLLSLILQYVSYFWKENYRGVLYTNQETPFLILFFVILVLAGFSATHQKKRRKLIRGVVCVGVFI